MQFTVTASRDSQIFGGCFSYIPETNVNLPYCRVGVEDGIYKIKNSFKISGAVGRLVEAEWNGGDLPGYQRDIVLSI